MDWFFWCLFSVSIWNEGKISITTKTEQTKEANMYVKHSNGVV